MFEYKGYTIIGSELSGYVVLSPYGCYAPKVFKFIVEAKQAINADIESK